MFKHLDHRPTLIERLGLHLAVVLSLTGFIGGALTLGGAASVVASASHVPQPHELVSAQPDEVCEAHLSTTAHHR